ncbi:molybdenum cofactor guanylyltransferase [Sphingobacterium shayense]|uniref:molybdenum cofactor guanylyltransferase n=1 Tax=Sphingobacterium shayense TaxID=626343 RepID=UPI001556DF5E|nr:molybdenum cofactor guanylyltransferase [Sphingobacterium shayense]NQD71879.1 molybdenum cofactor guanylyltransferase [Sphingobacterium shayense]
MDSLIGLVLCGGRSQRMGSDKGLLTSSGGVAWVVRQVRLLANYNIDVWVSLREEQYADYENVLQDTVFIPDTVPVGGPLVGLLSAHQAVCDKDFLVLACDMVSIDRAAIERLIKEYKFSRKVEVYLYEHNGRLEPLCAIYTAKALRKILSMQQQRHLPTFSLQRILENLNCKCVTLTRDARFRNYNFPTDL